MWLLVGCAAPVQAPVKLERPEDTAADVARGPLAFRFPLADRALFEQLVGVDHDPVVYGEGIEGAQCTNYDGRGFPWCYDSHDGSDFLLDGGFDVMDAGSTPIVAAADGVVVATEASNYDRCHATFEGVDCDGYPMEANYVILEHEGGYSTRYWHMKTDSVVVAVGDTVRCGDTLGLVGSSGYSSMPHLHFELQDAAGMTTDPYAGAWSQPETWWVEQGEAEGMPGSDCWAGG
ncbi:MAG: M23 family metallopeptidase [Pseudomonadota bacterium]|nr:M23 family metallopeptidase [Pseudomonadota bacterium]